MLKIWYNIRRLARNGDKKLNNTLKRFLQFGAIFIVLYFFLDFLTFAYIKTTYHPIEDYTIEINSPKIEITEAKATYINGYIKGNITNNTGEDIDVLYVKVNCYSERDNDLGTKFAKVENLKQGETRDFEIDFRFQEVKSFRVNVTKEAVIDTSEGTHIFDNFKGIYAIFSGLILIHFLF